MLRILGMLVVLYVGVLMLVYFGQRRMLFFPTHGVGATRLTPWSVDLRPIGYCLELPAPDTIWLMLHGNAGQAAHRDYVLPCLAEHDSFYVLEYPGYGSREGTPSRESMNRAALEAYQILRARFPKAAVCVLGESIGSGPACVLAREKIPPDKIVLVAPFDSLANVAAEKFLFLPVRWMLHDRWDNVESLRDFAGAVEIFGAIDDTIIPIAHAQALARQVPQARFVAIPRGHNDWPDSGQVRIRR